MEGRWVAFSSPFVPRPLGLNKTVLLLLLFLLAAALPCRLILALNKGSRTAMKGNERQIVSRLEELGVKAATEDASITTEMAFGMFDTRGRVRAFLGCRAGCEGSAGQGESGRSCRCLSLRLTFKHLNPPRPPSLPAAYTPLGQPLQPRQPHEAGRHRDLPSGPILRPEGRAAAQGTLDA